MYNCCLVFNPQSSRAAGDNYLIGLRKKSPHLAWAYPQLENVIFQFRVMFFETLESNKHFAQIEARGPALRQLRVKVASQL